MALSMLSRSTLSISSRLLTPCLFVKEQKRNYNYKGKFLFPGPGEVNIEDGSQKPDGVPETWTTIDVQHDFGYFDENTFPPAKEGETLEQYCRRVPNIWSPCKRSTDTVDVLTYMGLEWAQDLGPTKMGMKEMPLIKIPPESADWHVTYVPDYEFMLRDMMTNTRPFPIRVTDEEFKNMLELFAKSVKAKGIGHHFKARSFHEFWEELTGEPLKNVANVATWEEEIDNRIQKLKEKNVSH